MYRKLNSGGKYTQTLCVGEYIIIHIYRDEQPLITRARTGRYDDIILAEVAAAEECPRIIIA